MVALTAQQPNRHDDHNLPIDCVLCGDCLVELRKLPDCSVDACVVDPPYGLGEVKDIAGLLTAWIQDEDDKPFTGKKGFMGKEWDSGVPGPRYWREVLRVLKPGAHILCFSGTRTVDLMMVALRLAGFECRDVLEWLYGSGFPKSLAVDKAIDAHFGKSAERQTVGYGLHVARRHSQPFGQGAKQDESVDTRAITEPATPEAAMYRGFGTALKPSHEPIILARKPLSEKSIAENCLKWGTAGLNIDACRVNSPHSYTQEQWNKKEAARTTGNTYGVHKPSETPVPSQRFPSNLLLSHSVFCVPQGTKRVRGNNSKLDDQLKHNGNGSRLFGQDKSHVTTHGYADADGYEEVEDYLCDPSCPILQLDRQSGIRKSGAWPVQDGAIGYHGNGKGHGRPERIESSPGGASRYFSCFSPDIEVPYLYCSKASRAERNAGCEGLPEVERHTQGRDVVHWIDRHDGKGKVPVNARIQPAANDHPTVKSLSLMRWLVKLVGVPGGVILDPFCGSGSTLVACVYEGLHYIGIDQDQHYVNIAEARIAHAVQEVR